MEQNKNKPRKKEPNNLHYINLVYQFFIETFIGLIIGYFGGQYLDKLIFGERKLLVYILLVLGIFSALVNLVRRALRTINDEGGNKNEDEKS